MLKKFREWDAISKVAAILCLASPVALVVDGFASGPPEVIAWWEWLLSIAALGVMIPLIGAPQFAMLFLTRKARSAGVRVFFLICSIGMAIGFWYFLQVADLTGNSTAGLAAIFFPLYLAVAALILGLFVLWLERKSLG